MIQNVPKNAPVAHCCSRLLEHFYWKTLYNVWVQVFPEDLTISINKLGWGYYKVKLWDSVSGKETGGNM